MRRQLTGLSAIFLITFLLSASNVQAADVALPGKTAAQVYFSPDGGCTNAILEAISHGRSEILIQAYSFLSPPIAQALIAAHKRGVKVELILDKSERQEGLTPPTEMAHAGIAVYLDGAHAVANNRIVIIDKKTIITGSFNFNKASEELNAENMLVLHSEALARIYRDNWLKHRRHSAPF